jgi:hypothetical protein
MTRLVGASKLLVLSALTVACSAPARDADLAPDPDPWANLPAVANPDPELVGLGTRGDTYERLCQRGHGDAIANALCSAGQRPEIRGMTELLDLVGLQHERAFALTGNSTSLVAKSVSALNPRIIVFPRVGADLQPPATLTAVGFVRGERFVELVSRDTSKGDLNFYLLHFEQECDYTTVGCDLASALTEEIEHNWTAYSIYDQVDLEATSFDCLSCHRTGGVGTPSILRMQELSSPWLHWFPQRFVQVTESDRVLGAQFAATHQYEQQYGGIPTHLLTSALDEGSAAQLEALIRAEGYADQPNPFDGHIAKEMTQGASATWQTRFDSHLRGQAIAVPYPGIDVTDELKRDAAMRSYQDVVRGMAARESLLDIREVFSADAAEKLSFVPKAGADGRTVLLQMCARCHDGRSEPSLRKSRFNVLQLDQLSRAVKDLAIARITDTGPTRMPPWRNGQLTAESMQAALVELAK